MQNGQGCFGISRRSSGPNSMIWLDSGNNHGSGSRTRRYSNIRAYQGFDLSYVDDPVNGATIKVNTPGVYYIAVADNIGAGTAVVGIGVNALANILTNASSLTYAQGGRGFQQAGASGNQAFICATLPLNAGDTIYAFDNNSNTDTTQASFFTVVKVS